MAEASLLEKLVTVLRSRHVAVRDDRGDTSGRMTQGSAVALAEELLGAVRKHDEARGRNRDDDEPAPADPELAAMAAIVAVMDRLDEETCLLGTDVHERVIRWAMARWNIRD